MGSGGHLGPFLSFLVLLSPRSCCSQPDGCWSECLCPWACGTSLLRAMSLLKAAAGSERCVPPLWLAVLSLAAPAVRWLPASGTVPLPGHPQALLLI